MSQNYKAIMLGISNVGKTSIINAFRPLNDIIEPTVRYDLYQFSCSIDGNEFTIGLWDIPGQTQYRPMTQTFLRNVDVALIVYDITSEDSFDNVNEDYKLLIQETPNPHVFIIGNKVDLESERRVFATVGENYANQIGAKFFEVSALHNTNIVELFDALKLAASGIDKPITESINLSNTKEKKKGCC
ncbi:small GTP-binding protein, putative [Trichomonas vaginalis G3]|uniref:Small GTP-binding protein, putative n=1 Tax=Trichomonas vaginalis (strain ATCC PRA-98 / G3) TaxID=412133 RepID=A2EIK0_TRIV3|nr:GTPase protein [Trichomonas vaginalis G3]EAY07521.1 small GTP-binding protein, putative [Trichomonas vaginalis G3]KAI5550525.1 GTPase protein [Trichomonas vaginalis G3]|eukprot:XP_001319744.1 small GTP-binding protein [Trichomonas vaginalis G3]